MTTSDYKKVKNQNQQKEAQEVAKQKANGKGQGPSGNPMKATLANVGASENLRV